MRRGEGKFWNEIFHVDDGNGIEENFQLIKYDAKIYLQNTFLQNVKIYIYIL